jgi:hypothetical protein
MTYFRSVKVEYVKSLNAGSTGMQGAYRDAAMQRVPHVLTINPYVIATGPPEGRTRDNLKGVKFPHASVSYSKNP